MPYLGRVTSPAPIRLRASGLVAGYRRSTVVHGVDVTLRAGCVTALIGPNGSGKSTLLRSMAHLHTPTDGRVELGDGTALSDLSGRDLATRLTLLSQSRSVPGGVSVREVVEYGRHPHRGRWSGSDPDGHDVVERVMAMCGVDELAERPVDALSGGQLQRVWLASCLAQDTAVLLLDEPTTFLDLRYQVELLDTVRDLADHHGIAVGVVLHDLDQAAAIADEIVLLVDGRVDAAGTPVEVLTSERLSAAYGIRVDVAVDPATGHVRTRAVARHHTRATTTKENP